MEEEKVKPVAVPEKKAAAPKKSAATQSSKQNEPVVVEKEETELERKLRLQKIQEDADHDNAVALFGSEFISSSSSAKPVEAETKVVVKQVDWLESLDPVTPKDFDAISDHLAKALRKFDVQHP